jgi:hypothetical protein
VRKVYQDQGNEAGCLKVIDLLRGQQSISFIDGTCGGVGEIFWHYHGIHAMVAGDLPRSSAQVGKCRLDFPTTAPAGPNSPPLAVVLTGRCCLL